MFSLIINFFLYIKKKSIANYVFYNFFFLKFPKYLLWESSLVYFFFSIHAWMLAKDWNVKNAKVNIFGKLYYQIGILIWGGRCVEWTKCLGRDWNLMILRYPVAQFSRHPNNELAKPRQLNHHTDAVKLVGRSGNFPQIQPSYHSRDAYRLPVLQKPKRAKNEKS